jgi:hypothetical protein
MNLRVIDLDGSIPLQEELTALHRPAIVPLRPWGPNIRLACGFGRFRHFEHELAEALGGTADRPGIVTWYGSGDFHHVSLALLRRQPKPFNLLVLDNHPDWMRRIPFLHCGTWLAHACRVPALHRVFHVGGEVDFDNAYRLLAPWKWLRAGKITVFPAFRRFRRGRWAGVASPPLREETPTVCPDHLEELIDPLRGELVGRPLYISLDKDVMKETEAPVNWDSGHLVLPEVQTVLRAFLRAANGNLAGMDILGDWSPVEVSGSFRRLLHLTEHPPLKVDPVDSARRNARTNFAVLETIQEAATGSLAAVSEPWKSG